MPRGRTKDPDSICGQIRAYFKANPEEELTVGDMQIKFNLSEAQVRYAIQALKRQKLLASNWIKTAYYRGVA